MHGFLKEDYNLDALSLVHPAGDGFSLFVTPRFVQTYASGFEMLSTRVAKKRLARCDLFVDVGAHYGFYSLLAAEAAQDIRIIALEPVEENFAVLEANLRHNQIGTGRATCLQAAASSKSGRVQFYKSEASDNGSMLPHPSSETLARIEVDAVCLDDVISREKPQRLFIKMDTDGHELEVLRGLVRTMDACDDMTILLEMNPKMMRLAGTSAGEIIGFLSDRGFRLFAIDDKEARFYPLEKAENVAMMESRQEKSFYNVLCIRESHALSVLFFSHSSNLGGAERSLFDLIDGLSARGVLCSAVLPTEGPLRGELVKLGCAVLVPDGSALQRKGWWWTVAPPAEPRVVISAAYDRAMSVLVPEVGRISPDVVFSQTIVSPWGALCAEVLNLPHAVSAREYGDSNYNLSFALGFRASMNALYASSDAVFCATDDMGRTVFEGDPDAKIRVVYGHLRIDSGEGGPSPVPPPGPENPVTTLGLFGTVVAGKGQRDLIQACIALLDKGRNLRCVLAGSIADPSYAEALKETIKLSGHGGRFIWAGFVNNPYPRMRQMDILVSCSTREAWGRTLIEASLLGRPIIYARSGGPHAFFVHGEHGLAYEPGDSAALATAIESVIDDRAAAENRAHKAREYVTGKFTAASYSGTIFSRLKEMTLQPGRSERCSPAVGRLMAETGIASGIVLPRLYFADDPSGFCEGQVQRSRELSLGSFDIVFELPAPGYSCLRFDPTETQLVALAIHDFIITDENGTLVSQDQIAFASNGAAVRERAWEFKTVDPQVLLRLGTRARRVRIIGEMKKQSLSGGF